MPETMATVSQIPNLLDHQGIEGSYSCIERVDSSPSRKNQFKVISATAIPTTIEIPTSQKLGPVSVMDTEHHACVAFSSRALRIWIRKNTATIQSKPTVSHATSDVLIAKALVAFGTVEGTMPMDWFTAE